MIPWLPKFDDLGYRGLSMHFRGNLASKASAPHAGSEIGFDAMKLVLTRIWRRAKKQISATGKQVEYSIAQLLMRP